MANPTHKLPKLYARAAFTPATVNDETRTVDMVWTTAGVKVKRSSYYDGDFLEELSLDPKHVRMDRLASGRSPLLADHNGRSIDSVLGVIESARIVNGQGLATVRFAKDDPAADAVWNKVRQGILPNVSVGYRVHKFEKVSGGEGQVPTFRATDWEPHEVSLVTIGADPTAQLRAEDLETNPCEFIGSSTRGAPRKESSTMEETDQEKAARLARESKERAAEQTRIAEETRKSEVARISGIRHACRAAKLGDDVAEKMIADGKDLSEAREFVLEEIAKRSDATAIESHVKIEVGDTDREKLMRGATSALIQRFGLGDMAQTLKARGHKGFADYDGDGGDFRKMRLARIAQEFLERAGVNTRRMQDDEIVGAALTARAAGQNSTSDYAVLLESVLHKGLLGSYLLADDTWRKFCKTDTVQDFRPSNRYRTGSFGTLPTITENGEFQNVSIPDGSKAQISVGTKGAMIAVSRQALVNDDLGAILDTISKFGRAAGLSIESDVYALLNANGGLGFMQDGSTAFFSAGNGNLNATGSAISVQAIDADRTVLALQKDPSSNEFLNLDRAGELVLLVHTSLRGQALNINKSEWDVSQSSKFQVPNIVQGLFREVIASPRVGSTTRRYIFANPGDAAAIVVSFLNGEQAPYMEQKMGWRTDGTEMKLRIDYGVQTFDPKGAVTNAGV